MRARAPGKLVLSGAYAVLEGAPCLVAAVDRYVIADAARPAPFVADEVRAAIDAGAIDHAPWFDASALREHALDGSSRKLGLGSSAAILAASLAAALGDGAGDVHALRAAVFPPALAAHRKAQGGGSGVDVAASVFGGVLLAHLEPDGALDAHQHPLPLGTTVEVFASPVAAVTRELLGRVRALADASPARHRACLDAAAAGARAAVSARGVAALVLAVSAQTDALAALGEAAGAPIVTDDVSALRAPAAAEGGTFAPSGAGGGDIAVFVGRAPSSASFRALAAARGHARIEAQVGAEGAGPGLRPARVDYRTGELRLVLPAARVRELARIERHPATEVADAEAVVVLVAVGEHVGGEHAEHDVAEAVGGRGPREPGAAGAAAVRAGRALHATREDGGGDEAVVDRRRQQAGQRGRDARPRGGDDADEPRVGAGGPGPGDRRAEGGRAHERLAHGGGHLHEPGHHEPRPEPGGELAVVEGLGAGPVEEGQARRQEGPHHDAGRRRHGAPCRLARPCCA